MGYPEGVADILPLTSAQQGMLFHSEGENEMRGQYVAVISCVLNGPLDTKRLMAAMDAVLNARDAFRAGFLWQGVKQPVQVLRENVSLPWIELDWTARTDVEQSLKDLIKLEQTRQFDLKTPPLMAAALIKLSDTQWRLVWTVHHLISDGWSTGVALRDLFDRYSGKDVAKDIPSFKSHLAWLRTQGPLTDTEFWTDQFDGLEEPSLLPDADMKSAQTQTSLSASLDQDLMQQIERAAVQLKITPNTVLSGAWALSLRRLLQQDDIVYGTTTAGRPPEIHNIANAIGAFVNTLPVRCRIDPSISVGAFLRKHGQAEIERRKHEFAALAEVQNCAPFPSGTALFDTLFVNEGVSETSYDFDEIRISDLTSTQYSNYPLSFLVTPKSDLGIEIHFDPSRISDAAVRRVVSDYERILSEITKDPDCLVRDLLKPQSDIVPRIAGPMAEHVVTRFLHCARTTPQSMALTDDAKTLTYAEVSLRARQIAYALRQAGARNGDVVPVALPRGSDAVTAFLGVMMSGAAYVPLDLDYPADRIAQVLDTIQPKLIVTTEACLSTLPNTQARPVFVDTLTEAVDPDDVTTGDTAYVMFTSGSENRPKGVVISQGALAISTAARGTVYRDRPEVYLLLSSLAFDSSVAGLYWTLCTGGHLVIATKNLEQEPAKLGALIARHGVTHTLCLPGLARALLASVPKRDLRSLRVLIAAGEVLNTYLPQELRALVPGCRLINEYGPTEGTVWCTSFDATEIGAGQDVPIGRAIPGAWVGILDRDGHPADSGVVGEIVVAGPTVAEAYFRDPEQSQAHFFELGPHRLRAYRTGDLGVADETGCISFLGRRDRQVKIRGHRVELSEIEAVAQSIAGDVRVAALVLDTGGSKQIALALECPPGDTLCARVQSHLAASLPKQFHPSLVVGVAAFPELPNGKLDQKTLASDLTRNFGSQRGEAPSAGLEAQIAELFAEVLDTPCQSRDANFFDLGGDSLSTIKAYAMGQERAVHFEPTDLFSCPTVAELAQRVSDRQSQASFSEPESTFQISNPGLGKTTVLIAHCSIQFCRYMARYLGPDHSVVHIPSHRAQGTPIPLDKSYPELACAAISQLEQSEIDGPFVLCGYSAGAPMVMEMARQIGEDKIKGMVLLDPPFKMVGAEPGLQPIYYRTYKRLRYIIKGWKRRFRARKTLPEIKKTLSQNPDAEAARIRGVEIAHELAISAFRVPRFDRPAHVFLSRGNPSLETGDVLDTHLRHKTLHNLDMKHIELMGRPDAFAPIAAALKDCSDLETGNQG